MHDFLQTMEKTRSELFDRIADYTFKTYQWVCSGAPTIVQPKSPHLNIDLLEYQRMNHPLYQRYCEIHGVTQRGKSILDYPPLPVESFKRKDLCPFDPSLTVAEFHSSGTTENTRSIHKFRDPGLMQRSLFFTFTMFISPLMPANTRILSLMPSREDNPNSSLGYMISEFVHAMGGPGSGSYFSMANGLDVEGICAQIQQAEKENAPVHLMGPAFAYVEFLDKLGDRQFHCPAGSALLETGGYKGKSREIPKSDLRDALANHLGIERRAIYGEYGMCELSSQGYEICARNLKSNLPEEGLFIFPPWLKCLIYNPENMSPMAPDADGQIAFFDLCNLDSAAFILTGDIGRLVSLDEDLQNRLPGHPKFALKLYGRAPSAVPKGCSIAWDEWAK